MSKSSDKMAGGRRVLAQAAIDRTYQVFDRFPSREGACTALGVGVIAGPVTQRHCFTRMY